MTTIESKELPLKLSMIFARKSAPFLSIEALNPSKMQSLDFCKQTLFRKIQKAKKSLKKNKLKFILLKLFVT